MAYKNIKPILFSLPVTVMALSSLTMTGSTTNCSLYRKPCRCPTSSDWTPLWLSWRQWNPENNW